jgi:glycosyltransferase involved in cell wall biosynthesis
MQEYIRTRTKTPVTVVYNGTRAADIVAEVAGSNGSKNGPTLLYAGNLGRAQQLDLLISAWVNVHGRNGHHRWTMKFLGTGVMEKDLKELARSLGIDGSVVFAPPVSRQDAMREMRQASALYVSLQANEAFDMTIPSKVFDCMAVGRPILAGVGSEARDLLESTGANVCYEPGNQEHLEQGLERLMQDYVHLQQMACRNPRVIRDGYTREKAVGVLMGVFDSVARNGRR